MQFTGEPEVPNPNERKKAKCIAKTARKVDNRRERLQAADKLFSNQEAEAHVANQDSIDICAQIEEVGTTAHDKRYGYLRNIGLILDKWYDHFVVPDIPESDEDPSRGVMDGTIPSAVVDTGATSSVGKYGCGLKLIGKLSNKVFKVTTGQESRVTETTTMGHDLPDPACTFDMVPDVILDYLASTSKMIDAGYFTMFDGEEMRIYNAETTNVVTSKLPVFEGWRDIISTLWRIPIVKQAPVKQERAQKLKQENGLWTHATKSSFTTPFDHTNHKWDGSWTNNNKAYYNAHEKLQAEGEKKRTTIKAGAEKEQTKAEQVAELKMQLADLE